jgi:hypothetical protein
MVVTLSSVSPFIMSEEAVVLLLPSLEESGRQVGKLMKKSLRETLKKKKNKVMWKNFSRPNWGEGILGPRFFPKLGMKSKVSKKINTHGKIDL